MKKILTFALILTGGIAIAQSLNLNYGMLLCSSFNITTGPGGQFKKVIYINGTDTTEITGGSKFLYGGTFCQGPDSTLYIIDIKRP